MAGTSQATEPSAADNGPSAAAPAVSRSHAKRPGGRSARVQSAVFTAVGQLVGAGERETMTIPQVAELAGVNPTSIYRRWGTIGDLLGEVAVAALTQGEDLPDHGVLADDLGDWSRIIAFDIARPKRRAYLRAMASARDGIVEACPCWEIRRERATQMIERAAARGERVPSVRQVLDHIIAPLYHHAVFALPIDDDYATDLAGDVMAMVR